MAAEAVNRAPDEIERRLIDEVVLPMLGVAVLVGVLVGGIGVSVGVLVGVYVGVLVGVLVGGIGVSVGVLVGVSVGVLVGVLVGVAVRAVTVTSSSLSGSDPAGVSESSATVPSSSMVPVWSEEADTVLSYVPAGARPGAFPAGARPRSG